MTITTPLPLRPGVHRLSGMEAKAVRVTMEGLADAGSTKVAWLSGRKRLTANEVGVTAP